MKILLILLITLTTTVQADEFHLVVSGKAIHLNSDKKWNEKNSGLGFEYDFTTHDSNWIPFVNALVFLDSNKQTSKIGGGGIKYRFTVAKDYHIDTGVSGGLMTRYDHNNNDPFVYVLPFINIGNDFVSVNITYVPKIQPKMVSFVYINAQFKLMDF